MKRFAIALTVASAAVFAGTAALSQTATQAKKSPDSTAVLTFEVFKDAKGEYRWRLKASNSKIIADSGEGYKAKADCLHGIDLIKEGASKAKVDDKS
jgi:uncharacterized protein YegP (UPF0339 family)